MIYIFWTCESLAEAKKIVGGLLDKKLIACANIIPEIHSIYMWEGKLQDDREVKVILKTTANLFSDVSNYIQKNCSYEVPEISQVQIDKCNPLYLEWLQNVFGKGS